MTTEEWDLETGYTIKSINLNKIIKQIKDIIIKKDYFEKHAANENKNPFLTACQ